MPPAGGPAGQPERPRRPASCEQAARQGQGLPSPRAASSFSAPQPLLAPKCALPRSSHFCLRLAFSRRRQAQSAAAPRGGCPADPCSLAALGAGSPHCQPSLLLAHLLGARLASIRHRGAPARASWRLGRGPPERAPAVQRRSRAASSKRHIALHRVRRGAIGLSPPIGWPEASHAPEHKARRQRRAARHHKHCSQPAPLLPIGLAARARRANYDASALLLVVHPAPCARQRPRGAS